MFRSKYRYYYQGSEISTSEGTEQVFNKASINDLKETEYKSIVH